MSSQLDVMHKNHIRRLTSRLCEAKTLLYLLIVILDAFVFTSQTRHQNGDTHFLTLDEILDETKLLDISMKQKQWLMNEVCIITIIYHIYFHVLLCFIDLDPPEYKFVPQC